MAKEESRPGFMRRPGAQTKRSGETIDTPESRSAEPAVIAQRRQRPLPAERRIAGANRGDIGTEVRRKHGIAGLLSLPCDSDVAVREVTISRSRYLENDPTQCRADCTRVAVDRTLRISVAQ